MKSSGPLEAEIVRDAILPTKDGDFPLSLTKRFLFGPAPRGCEVACEVGIKMKQPLDRAVILGIESIVNLLAPTEGNRFFETPDGPKNLRFSGELPGPILKMEDGWQKVRIALHAPGTDNFWIAPIETVSESEEGFERVYQGSQILGVWDAALDPAKAWSAETILRVSRARSA